LIEILSLQVQGGFVHPSIANFQAKFPSSALTSSVSGGLPGNQAETTEICGKPAGSANLQIQRFCLFGLKRIAI
jgi:hypothetical protein